MRGEVDGIRVRKGTASIPFPLPDGYALLGFDESGYFAPRGHEPSERKRRMILCTTVSQNPIEGVRFKDGPSRSSYSSEAMPSASNYFWTELNGIHSKKPELAHNSILTRMISMAYLIIAAGYDGTNRTPVVIDRFWPGKDDEKLVEIFDYFGFRPEPGTLSIEEHADQQIPIVKKSHNTAKQIWWDNNRYRNHADSFHQINPCDILECMMHFEKDNPSWYTYENEFYDPNRYADQAEFYENVFNKSLIQ